MKTPTHKGTSLTEKDYNNAWALGYLRYQNKSVFGGDKRPYPPNSDLGRAYNRGYQAAYREYNLW